MAKILPLRIFRRNPLVAKGVPLLRREEQDLWSKAATEEGTSFADSLILSLRERRGEMMPADQLERIVYSDNADGQPWSLQCAHPGCEVLHPNAIETEGSKWFCHIHDKQTSHAKRKNASEQTENERDVLQNGKTLFAACCLHCRRVFALTRDIGIDSCPSCRNDLYPVEKEIVPGAEIECGDGIAVRIAGSDIS